MARHTQEQREFIIKRIGAFYTNTQICEAFKTRWLDTDCEPRDVAACSPANVLLGPDESVLFQAERERELAAAAIRWPDVQESLRIVLIGMHRDLDVQRERNAFDLANKTAAEIAKITTGHYAGKTAAPAAAPGDAGDSTITWKVVDPSEVQKGAA